MPCRDGSRTAGTWALARRLGERNGITSDVYWGDDGFCVIDVWKISRSMIPGACVLG